MAKNKEPFKVTEYVSQEDIDNVLNAAFEEYAEAKSEFELADTDLIEASGDGFDFEDDDLGLISNEDIEALLKGAADFDRPLAPRAPVSVQPGAAPPSDEEGQIINQFDIDALLSGKMEASSASPAKPEKTPDGEGGSVSEGMISQADIDALLNGETEIKAKAAPGRDDGGGLISQSDLDALLNEAMDAKPASGAEAGPEASGGKDAGGLIAQSEIDLLLSGAGNPPVAEAKAAAPIAPEEVFVPKEMNENGELISQSDIDSLLMEALNAEDASDAFEPDAESAAIARTLEAESAVDPKPEDSPAAEEGGKTVILAMDEEPSAAVRSAEPVIPAAGLCWYKRKTYQISAMAALVLLIFGSVVFVRSRSSHSAPQPLVLTFQVPKPVAKVVTAAPKPAPGPAPAQAVERTTLIAMPGFVVLSPNDNSGITCVTADLQLDFTDSATAVLIKDNEALVRNIIYGVINQALLSDDTKKVNKNDVALLVRAALSRVVPRDSLRTVIFGKFNIM